MAPQATSQVTIDDAGQHLTGLLKLLEITRSLAAENDLDRILSCVTEGACEALSCERATLYLFDEQRDELYTRVVTELEIEEIRSSIETGISGWVARRRRVANIPDPHVDARWNSSIDRQTGFTTRNLIAVPVISPGSDRLLGVLQLLNRSEGAFDELDERLVQAFAAHAATALERTELLHDAKAAEALQYSITVARSIQSRFLPDELPEVDGYELAAWWEPAEMVSGDYYDVLPLPDGRLGMVVGDVSGHGVGAALIMASVRAMLHVVARTCSDPAEIIRRLSLAIASDLRGGRFITLFIGALDTQTHELTWANAGHAPALHFRADDGECVPLSADGLPVGVTTEFGFPENQKSVLQPRDICLVATDGAIELKDPDGEMFGRRRLEDLLGDGRSPATQIVDRMRDAINSFHPACDPPDDVTILMVQRGP